MNFVPYPHQQRVANLLLSGKNVILQAPTGSGKTRAAMMPFLEAFHPNSDVRGNLPSKCIYSVPMRVLAKQFHTKFESTVSEYSRKIAQDISVSIQTGEQQTDRELASNLIFATIDQTLSSFLIAPYSLSTRKANLNAGAVISSYLVFDEFHLFDPISTLPTTLQMLKMLKGITPFLLMTATFSHTMLIELAEILDAEIVGITESERAEFANLASQDKTRCYHTIDDVMKPEFILEKHTGHTLVICNQIRRAREIYQQLRTQSKPETEVILLHSHFLPADRNQIEDKIRTEFGQDAKEGDFIVVSTQAIEVGLDITSTVLHTELAPANSIIQRAGRCARYKDDVGDIYIYLQALDQVGEVISLIDNPLPYSNEGDVIANTWDAFSDQRGETFSYDDEQAVIDSAHQDQDQRILDGLRGQSRTHRQDMYATMRGQEDARNLIRNIVAQSVTVHHDPHKVAEDPFAYPSFSVHPGSLQRLIEDWLGRREHASQIAIIRLTDDQESGESDAQSNQERYYATTVESKDAAWMAPLLVIHPNLATYDSTTGFITEQGGAWEAELPEKSSESHLRNYGYRLETYEEHIAQVYKQFDRYWREARWTAHQLQQEAKWQVGSIEKATRLAVLLHDVGKLSKGWQDWVRKYQQRLFDADLVDKTHLVQDGVAYAHTDFKGDDDRYYEIQKKAGKRPWHAVESAYSVWDILLTELDDNKPLARATYSAIARHHASQSETHQMYQLASDTIKHIEATFSGKMSLTDSSLLYGIDERVESSDSMADTLISAPHHNEVEMHSYLAYLLIVRVLRRADSKGTEQGTLEL